MFMQCSKFFLNNIDYQLYISYFLERSREGAFFFLQQGLPEDEKGRKEEAVPLYTDPAEMCLKAVCSYNSPFMAFDFRTISIDRKK